MSFYSLLDKFRGAWLGSLIVQKIVLEKQQIENQLNFSHNTSNLENLWSIKNVVSIMQEPKSIPNNWSHNITKLITQENSFRQLNASTLIFYILPIVLYYHDSWFDLSIFLSEQGKSLQKSQEEIDNIIVWCYAVRLALRGELDSHNLTERVVLGTGLEQKATIFWLEKVELFCLQGYDTEALLKELSMVNGGEIALSLFCFLNNSQDFYLTIQQALLLEKKASNISFLSSVLSGAYNGLTGIPANWRNLYQYRDFYQQIMSKTEEMTHEWLGIDSSKEIHQVSSVITAAKILQPRSQLKIISQQEY